MFKKHFIIGLSIDVIILYIICELTVIHDTSTVISEQVLASLRRMDVLRAQTVILDSLKENK